MRGYQMQLIRLQAVKVAAMDLKYGRRGKPMGTMRMCRLVDYVMQKNWRYGWNACAAFTQSFPDGERLEASLQGGLRLAV